MYYPYFRGKQYELIAVRESADLFAASGFVPIIEPVRKGIPGRELSGLKKTIKCLEDAEATAFIVSNPEHGELVTDPSSIGELFENDFQDHQYTGVGVLLNGGVTLDEVMEFVDRYGDRPIAFIHSGSTEGRELANRLNGLESDIRHLFVEEHCGKLYQGHFRGKNRILMRDGFQRQINKNYPVVEFFSDLHITYKDESVNGFGDFLMVGNEYSETGGPAYAVAIHLTFIDGDKDGEMHIFHFVSDRQDTPTDPAGKFAEALAKLVAEAERPDTLVERTPALGEFIELYRIGHYPGLGHVKKLSMLHHVQTLANYFSND